MGDRLRHAKTSVSAIVQVNYSVQDLRLVSPWGDCTKEFKNHLDELAKLPIYCHVTMMNIANQTAEMLPGEEQG